MSKPSVILVVGAANLQRGADGSWVTKAHIASYLHELADHFGSCIWISQLTEEWYDAAAHAATHEMGRIDADKVHAVPIKGNLHLAPRNCLLFLRHLAHCRYSIVFLPAALPLVPALPFARIRCRRLAVYLAGDFLAPIEGERDGKQSLWGFVYRASFRFAMRTAHTVIARGRYLAGIARRFNDDVHETFPLGHMQATVRDPRIDLAPNEPRRILYMGLVRESKGVGDLIQALHEIKKRHETPEIQLDILGHGPERSRFEQEASDLGLGESVTFHGWVQDPRRIDRFIVESHVLVMPSSTHPEGVPRVIDEALVRGVPVVATRIAGVPDEFRDDELLLVDPGNRSQLAGAIEQILFDPSTRRRYIEGAGRRRKHWGDAKSAADQHARLLKEGIASSH